MTENTDKILEAAIEDDQLVIRIGVRCLVRGITAADTWPITVEGDPAKIVDQDQFLQDLIAELMREDEQGATSVHLAIDAAAEQVFEQGYESVEMPEEPDDDY